METTSPFEATLALMHDLRRRCEWDAAQTHESLRPYLIEEAHELDEAIRDGNVPLMREELGDVLLQVLFHSVLAEEQGTFTFRDVADGLVTKMRGRHPHLYGEGVKEPWERMKAKKRAAIGDGLPDHLPSLHRAHRLQDRAAGVGLDWPDAEGPAQKITEELEEVRAQMRAAPVEFGASGAPELDERHAAVEAELGDLLFACVNLCRKNGVHAALALDRANATFERRVARVQALAAARGIVLHEASLETLDLLWNEVKQEERRG